MLRLLYLGHSANFQVKIRKLTWKFVLRLHGSSLGLRRRVQTYYVCLTGVLVLRCRDTSNLAMFEFLLISRLVQPESDQL